MTRVVVIEDEPPACDRLVAALHKLDPQLEVVATLASVAESLRWFEQHLAPDLVFADVQLSDGLSLEIFAHTAPSFPIVFCTAYDEYLLDALGQNGIAYLLKPYSPAQLREALDKYRRLEAHFASKLAALSRTLAQAARPSWSSRSTRSPTSACATASPSWSTATAVGSRSIERSPRSRPSSTPPSSFGSIVRCSPTPTRSWASAHGSRAACWSSSSRRPLKRCWSVSRMQRAFASGLAAEFGSTAK
jgi:CheY-like chemotaxis protein